MEIKKQHRRKSTPELIAYLQHRWHGIMSPEIVEELYGNRVLTFTGHALGASVGISTGTGGTTIPFSLWDKLPVAE